MCQKHDFSLTLNKKRCIPLGNMGNLCCCKRKVKRKIVILLVGLDNAGKTVAAKGLAGESVDGVVPTVGFSVVNLEYLDFVVKLFDLGGGPNIRGIWHKYFVDAHGVIFVVDSSDIDRLDEAKQVLGDLLAHKKITGKPVLLLANKQDNEMALDEVDMIETLDLESIVNANECPTLVETCSAFSENKIDPGIKKGYDWLLNYISRNYQTLNDRVERDVYEQKILEGRLRLEKMAKIRALKELEMQQNIDEIESYSNYERNLIQVTPKSESNSTSEHSIESFPPVYHTEKEERPKSAVQIVRQQLEMSKTGTKMAFITRASNKTAPLHLYEVPARYKPRSASVKRRDLLNLDDQRKKLRSAGDASTSRPFIPNSCSEMAHVPSRGSGDDFHQELVSLRGFNLNQNKNGLLNNWEPQKNGLVVVEID